MDDVPGRNIKRELLGAFVVLVMLATAVGLSVVLTRDSFEAEEVGIQPTVASMAPTEEPPTAVPASPTPVPASATPEPTATQPPPTETPEPPTATATTEPPTATATESPVPPTATSEPTEEAATATETSTPFPTRTPVPRLAPTDSATPEPTSTPTRTPGPTRTPVPRFTATDTATPEPSSTPTRTPGPTRTPVPRFTATGTPTRAEVQPTATLVLATPVTPTAHTCSPPPGWQTYIIRPGDNLFRLSLRAGIPLQEMQRINCIPNAADIEAGETLYVPPSFFSSSPSGASTSDTVSSIPRQTGCTDAGSRITFPSPGAVVSGRFTVAGSATLGENNDRFNFYKIELREENDSGYINLVQRTAPVDSGSLGTVDTANFAAGHYELKLTVVDITGNYIEPCAIRITIR
ncbi:MAG: hypothetical protein Kow0077_04620 [Anaerolineae bacterium]